MNLNERSTSAATPDLSRLYLISGRIMFDDDDQALPGRSRLLVMQRRLSGIILLTVPTT